MNTGILKLLIFYFEALFDARFSDDPQRKVKEEAAYVYFMDFIEECEGM